jgi:hypothetical protein
VKARGRRPTGGFERSRTVPTSSSSCWTRASSSSSTTTRSCNECQAQAPHRVRSIDDLNGDRSTRRSLRHDGKRGPYPVVAVLSREGSTRGRRQTSPSRPPKGADPGHPRLFPCKPAVFRGPREGAMIATVDPGKPTPWWWAKAMPPLWRYFTRLLEGTSRVCKKTQTAC